MFGPRLFVAYQAARCRACEFVVLKADAAMCELIPLLKTALLIHLSTLPRLKRGHLRDGATRLFPLPFLLLPLSLPLSLPRRTVRPCTLPQSLPFNCFPLTCPPPFPDLPLPLLPPTGAPTSPPTSVSSPVGGKKAPPPPRTPQA